MSLTVKAYLRKNAGSEEHEIRRFGIEQDVTTSYAYLVGKVSNVFPELLKKSFHLFWRDSDGDRITFSSDDELMEALTSVSDGIFKIYVEPVEGHKQEEKPQEEPKGELHYGITCDGCQGSVHGLRYKCTVCLDYDLCQKCKSLGLHPEHEMKVIEKSLHHHGPRSVPLNFGFHPHFPVPPHGQSFGFGPHFKEHFHAHMKPHCPPPHCPPPHCPPPHCPPGVFNCPPPPFTDGFAFADSAAPGAYSFSGCGPKDSQKEMRKAWKRFWKVMANGGKKKCKREGCQKSEGRKAEEKDKKSSSSSSSEDEGCKENRQSGSTGDDSAGEYLRNVGQSVAAMLDPLGISVEVDVEHGGKRHRCHKYGGPWMKHGHHHGGWKHPGKYHWRWGAGDMCGPRGGFCFTGQAPEDKKKEEERTKPEDLSKENEVKQADENVEMSTMNQPVKENDSDWTFVKEDEAKSSSGNDDDVSKSAQGIKAMQLTDGGACEPAFVAALSQMHSMGFYDDGNGGSLYEMMVRLNGDIEKAIDEINGKKKGD